MSSSDSTGTSTQRISPSDHAAVAERRLSVAEILRAHVADYLQERGNRSGLHERSTLAQLVACRTAALGGHTWSCASCGETRVAYNSCRNRFCIGCGGAKRFEWLDQLSNRILPVTHFHLVFTLPHELSGLILAQRQLCYGLLFQAAWESLSELATDPKYLGAEVGAILVLHTWGQTLGHHPHIHAVVPGGGRSLDGKRWQEARGHRRGKPFLLPVKVLSRLFRGKFLAGLQRLQPALSPQWLRMLWDQDWVVFSQPPAHAAQGPAAILKYLARYVAGAAISDSRLLSHDPTGQGKVKFSIKNYRKQGARETLELSGIEFTRRLALHLLPRGFQRIRYYGLLAHRDLKTRLEHCRKLLAESQSQSLDPPQPKTDEAPEKRCEPACCPKCQSPTWTRIAESKRPRLWELFQSSGLAPSIHRQDSS